MGINIKSLEEDLSVLSNKLNNKLNNDGYIYVTDIPGSGYMPFNYMPNWLKEEREIQDLK